MLKWGGAAAQVDIGDFANYNCLSYNSHISVIYSEMKEVCKCKKGGTVVRAPATSLKFIQKDVWR